MRAAFLVAAGLLAHAPASAQTAELYVLAGQSNMSGHGRVETLSVAERTRDPNIRLYANDGKWKTALDPLDDATDQTDAVSADPNAKVGPGLFFARRMRQLGHARIDLLPCARGGTSIELWKPASGRDTLYGSCMARIAETKARPAGILWYQGEADSTSPEKAQAWRGKFEAMVARVRSDLKAPKLPVVLVQLSDPASDPEKAARYPGWQTVQASQQAIALPCARVVPGSGLGQNPDQLHISTEGQRELGLRLAAAMDALRKQGCH